MISIGLGKRTKNRMPPPTRRVRFSETNPWNFNNNNYPNRTRNNRAKNKKIAQNSAYRGILNAIKPSVNMEVSLILPRGWTPTEKAVLAAYETYKYGYYGASVAYPSDLELQRAVQKKVYQKVIKDAGYAVLDEASTVAEVRRELSKPVYAHIPEDFRTSVLNFADKQLGISRKYNRFSRPLPCNNAVNWNAPLENWEPPPPPPSS